jgi:hypothetical protein
MKKLTAKKAFSLFELSLVILICGLVIAGITQGSKMVKKSRLAAAGSLTQNSPVKDTENLLLWLETSLAMSFVSAEARDGTPISIWYDISQQKPNPLNANQTTGTNQPKFYTDVFDSALPAVRFDGSDDFLGFDGSDLANNAYTVFVVAQRSSNKSDNFFIAGSSTATDANLKLGFSDGSTIMHSHYSNDLTFTTEAYSSPQQEIHTFWFNTIDGKKYWLNGGSTPDAAGSSQTTALSSFAGASLGNYSNSSYFQGDVAEIIIFTRSLKTEERRAIEDYLSKKYRIKIS